MLDLTNAKSITINNKDVKKLELAGKVIWEKIKTSVLTITSPLGDNVTVENNDNVTIAGTLLDNYGEPIAGATIHFYTDLIYKTNGTTTARISIVNQTLPSSYQFRGHTGTLIIGDFTSTGNAVGIGTDFFMILQQGRTVSQVTGLSNVTVQINGNLINVNGATYDVSQYNINLSNLYAIEHGSVEIYGLHGGKLDSFTTDNNGAFTTTFNKQQVYNDLGISLESNDYYIFYEGAEGYTPCITSKYLNFVTV